MSTPKALIGIAIFVLALLVLLLCAFIVVSIYLQREDHQDAALQLRAQRNKDEIQSGVCIDMFYVWGAFSLDLCVSDLLIFSLC